MSNSPVEISPASQPRQLQAELQAALAELKTESANADVAELARLLVHDFNNFLNSIVLSLAVLEQSGEASSASVAPLRSQAERVSALIKEFHNYRRKVSPTHLPFDLNLAVGEAARQLAREHDLHQANENGESPHSLPNLTLELSAAIPQVKGVQHDFARMIKFLLRNSLLIASMNGGRVNLKTSHADGAVDLTLEISTASSSGNPPTVQLESLAAAFSGVSSLELIACNSIARRSHAKILVESRPNAVLIIRVKAPAAAR